MHISAESREQRRCLKKKDAPLPNEKLGTVSEVFPQHKRARIDETLMRAAKCDDVLSDPWLEMCGGP